MELEEKYQQAYELMNQMAAKRRKRNRYIALGYTSNLDLLCDFQVERLNELIAKHAALGRLENRKAANPIKTMKDMLETIVYYCSRGIGGEVDVEDVQLVEKSFSFQQGVGGTAVQAAKALAEIGCPSVVHLTDDSKDVCGLLKSPSIYSVSESGDLVHTDEIEQMQEQEIHFIIQFKKGDKIEFSGQEIEIPCSNRLILTKITVNEFVPFSEAYFHWIEQNAKMVSSNVLSSFNCLSDQKVLEARLEYVKKHILAYKSSNPEGVVYFEDAHYHNYAVRELCLETIYPYVDIVSLNEEELKYTLEEMYHLAFDVNDICCCVEGAKYLCRKLGVRKGMIVHTKDYSMYVGAALQVDIETGLMHGNLLATAKAQNGSYGTRAQIQEVLGFGLSPKGLENYKKIGQSKYAKEVVLVPSRYIDKPRYTIGLGDSFVGGVQMCF